MSPPGIAILGAGIFAKEGKGLHLEMITPEIHHQPPLLIQSDASDPSRQSSSRFLRKAHLPAIASVGTSAVELKAVYSRSEKSASQFAADAAEILKLTEPPKVYHDGDPDANLDTLLARADISAVIVVLPITTQPDIIRKVLKAGKHVLSEKPVAPDVQGGIGLINEYTSVYKPRGLVWRVAENFELEPAHQAAAKAIKEGKIGKVTSFNARAVNFVPKDSKWYKTPWRTIPDYQGGFLLDGGVHTIAALRVILPSRMVSLSGHASLNMEHLTPHDTITAVVKTEGGSHGIVELFFGSPVPSRAKQAGNGTSITGIEGWIWIASAENDYNALRVSIHRVQKNDKGEAIGETVEVIDERRVGVELELKSFLNAISGSDDGFGSPVGALEDVAFIQAALNSNGSSVDLVELVKL